jgi:starch-binding outer membrane protein SusE/F
MKHFPKYLFALLASGVFFMSCSKIDPADPLQNDPVGVNPGLTSSVTALAPAPADSNSNVVTFSWTNPNYANDPTTTKYIIQIDSTGRGFAKAISTTVIGVYSKTFMAKEINTMLLSLGFAFNVAYNVDVRLISSYGNNNERHYSNVLTLKMTPYKVPPIIALPASGKLFLVGDASQGGWNNPVPVPSQQFGQIDETTFVGVFNLNGGKQYLVLPVNGDWSHKYSVIDGTVPATGGKFGYDLPTNFNGPATSGWYKIILDFQHGIFTVIPYTGPSLPNNLYIVGDATPGGWNNPVPVPSQQFTRLNSVQFQLATLPITGGNQYLLLPVNGDWSHKYAVPDNTVAGLANGGFFGYDVAQNFPAPAVSGNYKFDINFGVTNATGDANKALFVVTKL